MIKHPNFTRHTDHFSGIRDQQSRAIVFEMTVNMVNCPGWRWLSILFGLEAQWLTFSTVCMRRPSIIVEHITLH